MSPQRYVEYIDSGGLTVSDIFEQFTPTGITAGSPRRLEPALQQVFELLRTPGRPALNAAYAKLVDTIGTVSPRLLRPAHQAHTSRLALLQERLSLRGICRAVGVGMKWLMAFPSRVLRSGARTS